MTRSRSMAFREKLAWVTLGSMLIAYTIYFSLLATVFDPSLPDGPRTVQMLMLFGGVTVVQAIVVAIVSAVLAVDLAPIRVNAVTPGLIATEMWAKVQIGRAHV